MNTSESSGKQGWPLVLRLGSSEGPCRHAGFAQDRRLGYAQGAVALEATQLQLSCGLQAALAAVVPAHRAD